VSAALQSRPSQVGALLKSGILPVATLLLVVFMVLPVPAFILDIGFIANITVALAVLMVALNAAKPLDFSSFPTVLLFATLMRLSLNVASTRVVLVDGHNGPDAAGAVIEAFGNFLIGGDYVVGIFVFAILMIINLVVISKGAGRVSEVTARFTLDAMPGKQMAIDADLNAGLLSPDEAKQRRVEVATESDFYGSMDGASKFVKGDAIAGVLILVINIIGGIILGTVSHDLAIGDAAETYVLLAVGDALVAQIPALLLSIAAASIVTRVSSPMDLSGQIGGQFSNAKAWYPVAIILAIMAILPGMPHFILFAAAGLSGFIAWRIKRTIGSEAEEELVTEKPEPEHHISWGDVTDSSVLNIEIGYGLVPLVDERKDAPLMHRLTGIRRQLSRTFGFVIPQVRVTDNMALEPNSYRIQIGGVSLGEDQIWPDNLLALDSGEIDEPVSGKKCKDPTFGLDAVWITPEKRSEVVVSGYTVVDPSTVVATHFNHLVSLNVSELFGMDEAQGLIDKLKDSAPQLADGLTPKPLSLFQIASICRSLLAEGIPLKDFRRIAEAMIEAVDEAAVNEAPSLTEIVENVRKRIGSLIIQSLVPIKLPLPVMTLGPELESLIQRAVQIDPDTTNPLEPELIEKIIAAAKEAGQPVMSLAKKFAIITSPSARRVLLKILKPTYPETPILSFEELPDDKAVEVIAVIGGQGPVEPARNLDSQNIPQEQNEVETAP